MGWLRRVATNACGSIISSLAYFLKIASKDPTMPHLGQWIFKGYVHDRNFVGRWRETSTVVGMAGLEGSFVMTLRREMS